MKYPVTNQVTIRRMFWGEYPEFKRIPAAHHNDYPSDIRMAFCDFVETLSRNGSISEALAARSTL